MAILVKVSISFIFQAKLFLGNFLWTFGDFFLVTLPTSKRVSARASERAREREMYLVQTIRGIERKKHFKWHYSFELQQKYKHSSSRKCCATKRAILVRMEDLIRFCKKLVKANLTQQITQNLWFFFKNDYCRADTLPMHLGSNPGDGKSFFPLKTTIEHSQRGR